MGKLNYIIVQGCDRIWKEDDASRSNKWESARQYT